MPRCSIFAALVILGFATACATPRGRPTTFYVAPDGNDAWSGKRRTANTGRTDGPLGSLEGARNAIRRLKSRRPLSRPVEVRVRPGHYHLTEPFVLEPADSGRSDCPITYKADGEDKPIFSGGRRITGWQRGANGVWTAMVPEVKAGEWFFRSLFVNGERRPRTRTPNDGYFHVAGKAPARRDPKIGEKAARERTAFCFKPGDIKPWEHLDEVNVVVTHSWATSRHRIASVDPSANIVEFTGPARWPFLQWRGDQRYYVENLPEALDAPGEWYLDRREGVLSYIPPPGEDPREAEIVAPVLTELVRLRGDADAGELVEHVRLSGLAFRHADWTLGPRGHSDAQADVSVGAAVALEGAHHCVLENVEVAHVGRYGVSLGHGCRDNRLERCHIHDLGAGGVLLGETGLPEDERGRGERNTVFNCFIHDGGHVHASGVGVWIGKSSYNAVRNNEISDFFYTGVSVGWSWGYQPSSAHDNLIEYNHIHHIGFGVLSDMGGIYTLGQSQGTRERYNIIHHVESATYGGWGIYPDEGSTDILIENNIVYRTKTGGFHQHYGRDNIVRNNVFAFARTAQLQRTRNEKHRSFVFERNIVYYDEGDLLASNWSGGRDRFEMDHNIYWNASGEPVKFAGKTSEEWQEIGHDAHSAIADPLFVDAQGYDFRLRPGSPALKLGFKPIDTSEVGLRGSREWVELPKSVKRNWPEPQPSSF